MKIRQLFYRRIFIAFALCLIALPIFGAPADLDTIFCKASMQRGEIKPFTDGDGNPKARRVVVKTSIEHVEIPAVSFELSTGQ